MTKKRQSKRISNPSFVEYLRPDFNSSTHLLSTPIKKPLEKRPITQKATSKKAIYLKGQFRNAIYLKGQCGF